MPDRKQFLNPQVIDEELGVLIRTARTRGVSDDELKEQSVSFAFGNAMNNQDITKDTVRETSKRLSVRS